MATINAMRLQECSSILRKELKEWEQAFAAANGGRKAGRDDIKADAAIGMSLIIGDSLVSCESRLKTRVSSRLTESLTNALIQPKSTRHTMPSASK